MELVRAITSLTLVHNFTFTAKHILGLDNSIGDSLSRFQIDRFHSLAPNASSTPCTIPSISNGNLTASVYHYFGASLVSNTHRAYGVGQHHFITFCLLQGTVGPTSPILPASEIT